MKEEEALDTSNIIPRTKRRAAINAGLVDNTAPPESSSSSSTSTVAKKHAKIEEEDDDEEAEAEF